MAERKRQSTLRRFARFAVLLPVAVAVPMAEPVLGLSAGTAAAQQWEGGLFGRLFGGRQRRAYEDRSYDQPPPRYYIDPPSPRRKAPPDAPRTRNAKKTDPAVRRPGAGGGAAAAAAAVPSPAAKAPDAKVVLVVGDFMALSLAKGLEASTTQNANLRVVDRTDGSSGLVRDDHLDWPERVAAVIDEEKPAAVLVMLGSNDRQTLRAEDGARDLRSPEWTSEYTRRIDALAAAVAAKKLPLIWVGLPAFKSAKTSDDVAYFNELYRAGAAKAGAEFADVWDGFVDANGGFVSTGPDIAGQPARLRNADGITMTANGARKLAFFVEKPLEKVLGSGVEGSIVAAAPKAEKAVPQNPANATAVPAVALANPSLDGGEALLAARPPPRAAGTQPSPRERLVDAGSATPPSSGRADDFAWNAKGGPVLDRPQAPILSRGSLDLESIRAGRSPEAPKPMPTLEDAIIEDWSAAEKADAARRAAATPPRPETAAPR